jgi:hypothetical protein
MNACKKTPKKFELLNNVSLHVLILFIILSSLFLFYISKIEADALNKEVISYINNFDVATLGISKTFISDNIVNFVKSPPVPDYENNFINGIGTSCSPTDSVPCKSDGSDPLGFAARLGINAAKPKITGFIDQLNNKDDKTVNNLFGKLKIEQSILKPEYFDNLIAQFSASKDRLTEEINTKVKEEIFIVIFFLILLVIFINLVPIKFFHYCNDTLLQILGELILVFLLIGIIEVWFFKNVASKFAPTNEGLIVQTFKDKILSIIK